MTPTRSGIISFVMVLHSLDPIQLIGRLVSVAVLLLAIGCSDKPMVLSVQIVSSPNMDRKVLIEELDNGLGFGLGALFQEVHVVRSDEQATVHGDRVNSVIFYAITSEYQGQPIAVRWKTNTKLQVIYDKALTPAKMLPMAGEVVIEYVAK